MDQSFKKILILSLTHCKKSRPAANCRVTGVVSAGCYHLCDENPVGRKNSLIIYVTYKITSMDVFLYR